jgi:predicted DNA-binding transcriptional regulator AlpA
MTTENSQLVSAKQLAKMLSTSVRSVWRYRASGHLPKTVKISGAIRWKMSDIELFTEKCNCDMDKFRAMQQARGSNG